MAEPPIRIPVEAFDPDLLSASLAELHRRLTEGLSKAAAAASESAVKTTTAATEKKARATRQTSKADDEHAEILKKLEKAYYSALKPSEKTAVLLADLHRLDLTAIKDARARAEAELMKAGAIDQVAKKQADQKHREDANKGRSLSMLFDEQNELLKMLPGRLGQYAQALGAAKDAAGAAAEKIAEIRKSGEAGSASILAMGATLGSFITIGAAVVGTLGSMQSEFLATVTEISKVARATGISAEQMSRYQVAAQRYGFDLRELADAHGNLAEKIQRAANGDKNLSRLFEAVNVKTRNLDGSLRDVGEVFLDLTDRLSTMSSETEALALAQEVLGEDGTKKLLPAIRSQAGAFREAAAEADALGLTLSGKSLEAARQHKQAADDLTLAWASFKKSVAEDGAVSKFFDDLRIGLANTLGDGVVIGQKRLESGTLATVKAQRMWNESVGEFAERVRVQREELAAANRVWEEQHRQVGDVTAALEAAKKAEEERAQAAKDAAQAAREAEAERKRAAQEAMRDAAQVVAWQREALEEERQVHAAMRDARIRAEGEAIKAAAAAREEELAAIQADAEAAVEITLDRVRKEIEAEMALKAARKDAAQAGFGAIMAWAETAAQLVERYGKDAAKAELVAFRIRKAASIAAIVMNTAAGVSQAMTLPPPADVIKAAAVGVSGAAGIAAVAAQKPPQVAHMGGMSQARPSLRPGEVPATLEQGEVVVSASQARALGGPQATLDMIRKATSGSPSGAASVIVVDRKAIARTNEHDYLAGGRLRRIVRGQERYGLLPARRRT